MAVRDLTPEQRNLLVHYGGPVAKALLHTLGNTQDALQECLPFLEEHERQTKKGSEMLKKVRNVLEGKEPKD